MSKHFIACYNDKGEMEHFEVPEPVYIYIKQMENHIKFPRLSNFALTYSDRITVDNVSQDKFNSGYSQQSCSHGTPVQCYCKQCDQKHIIENW